MQLQAVFTADDLMHVLQELTPTRIALDDSDQTRSLLLEPPSEVQFRDGEGAVVKTSASVKWDVVGITVPVVLRSVQLLLIPTIERDDDGGNTLALQVRLEELDLSALPGFLDDKLRTRINERLEKPASWVRWNFTKTLDFNFLLPDRLTPRRNLHLSTLWGAIRVTDEGFAMAASISFLTSAAPNASVH